MYVTRPISLYRNSPSSLSLLPPEGPNSGILVIQDEESETTLCFGKCKDPEIRDFPIPQNKAITISHTTGSEQNGLAAYNYVMPIPVLNQPLSSHLFYVTVRQGKHRGEAYTSSKEEDTSTCCFCTVINDVKPRPLDHHDVYQQFQVFPCGPSSLFGFYAKSVASDGFPPSFLRRKGWKVLTSTHKNYELTEALGLDTTLRARLPDFNFPLSYKISEPVVVGKWYCPFIFINDGKLIYQSQKPYYEMTLEQRWEQIYTCENYHNEGNFVTMNVIVKKEVVLLAGQEALGVKQNKVDGVIWFKGNETSVGLNLAIVERMKWEQERAGWFSGGDNHMTVTRTEEYEGKSVWKTYGCYILVERFVLKRADQSVVLTYDFKHTHQISSKWE